MAKRNYVLDTSVYLTDAESVFKFKNNDIFVPLKVLEEIDKNKKRHDSAGVNARRIIRILDDLRKKGNLQRGVRIDKGLGILRVMPFRSERNGALPSELDSRHPDHIIIATALGVKKEFQNRKTIVVSRDINMRVICDSIGMPSEEYESESVVTSSSELYTGFATRLVDDAIVDRFYDGEDVFLEREAEATGCYANQYIMLVSNANPKKTALGRFVDEYTPLRSITQDRIPDWNIRSKNKEQSFAIDLLLDPRISIVTMVGRAGSGKTLCAIAAGLQQTLGLRENYYSRLIVSRPVQPLGKDIGFLPGSMEEKMLPWLMPIQDNLKFLLGDDKTSLQMYMDKGKIEIEALTYIRGRSISNAYIIIDEAQNLTKHEIKTIITRIGEGSKIVLTGDIEQIDNIYVNETSNGLAHVVEKFKDQRLAGHVTFTKGERSELATLASKIL